MRITNNTSLSYQEIGKIIDSVLNSSIDDTHWSGQVEELYFYKMNVKIKIKYFTKYSEWIFSEVERWM